MNGMGMHLINAGLAVLFLAAAGASAEITQFTIADQSSGSTLFTNSPTVNVAIVADASAAAYAVTATGDQPAAWQDTPPAAFTITGDEGTVTLYGWVKDAAGNVSSKPAAIYCSAEVPVAYSITVTNNHDGTATVTWSTDVPALGAAKYGPVKMDGSTPNVVEETAIGTVHSVALTGIVAGTHYKIVLVNNEVLSPPIYWPDLWPEQCPCHRITILDLIFIRNHFGQNPATGDNECADVTHDGRINILDLIAVRNKLNTTCP